MIQIRNLINVSGSEILLPDFNGLTIAAGDTVDGLMFGESILQASLDVIKAIASGILQVSDGANTYEGDRAVNLIKGTADQLTRDGKVIITTSDRPQDHYRYFTTCGDDWDMQSRGTGTCILYSIPPSTEEVKDVRFIDDIYLKDGSMLYLGADMGSWLRVDVVAPAGFPFPAKAKNGNYDIVNGSAVLNATNTGSYFILPQETTVHRFINKMAMFATGRERENIDTAEPNYIPKGWIIRLKIHNASATETIKATITLGLYRKITL